MTDKGDYILTGFLRFESSDERGVMAKVISVYYPDCADPSDVPIYRKLHQGGRTVTKADLEAEET